MSGKEGDAVVEAIRIIRAAGRSELLAPAALEGPVRARTPRRASEGVAAAIMPVRRRRRDLDAGKEGRHLVAWLHVAAV